MFKRVLVSLIALSLFGLAMTPWKRLLTQQELRQDLLPTESLEGQNSLNQQLAFVSLGGLRSLVAAFLSLEAFECFRNSDWPTLEKRYHQIVTLSPHNVFYWDTGAWHLAYNAASDALDQEQLPLSERRQIYKNYIDKGKAFLLQGVHQNPSDWVVLSRLGNLLSDPRRYPNYEEARAAYQKARQLGGPNIIARQEFYSLARIPSKAKEAWQLGRQLYQDPSNRMPSLATTLFALENRLNLHESQRIPFRELFPSDKLARSAMLKQLSNGLNYPTDGLREALEKLPDN